MAPPLLNPLGAKMHSIYRVLTRHFSWVHLASHLIGLQRFRTLLLLEPHEKVLFESEAKQIGLNHFLEWESNAECQIYAKSSEILPFSEIDLVIVSQQGLKDFGSHQNLIWAHLAGTPVVDFRTLIQDAQDHIQLEETGIWSYLSGATRQTPLLQGYGYLKEALEPLLAILLLILLSPLLILTALLIRVVDPGPILYSQVRAGYLGEPFKVYKFRTMRANAEFHGPQWARPEDHRITPLGRWLRSLHIDELPQLWNVIRGEMRFVGPRPERPEFYERLKEEIPLFHLRTWVKPGITGWAQVCAGYAASVAESRKKLEFDLYYIQHQSPVLDLLILFKTVMVSLPIELSGKEV